MPRATQVLRAVASNLATLRVHGVDAKGIVATLSNILDNRGYTIAKSEHWTDRQANQFYHRIEFDKATTMVEESTTAVVEQEIQEACQFFQLDHQLNWRERRPRVAIMVSKYDHCLWELLLRHSAHEIECDIELVISNHESLRPVAESFGIPFKVFPITPLNKPQQEAQELHLLQQENQIDVVVLARYMQVLSENFLQAFPNRIINIHHSFLPAFSGGRPYHQAHFRGVKLIGATAHYATAHLDEGPIIEQDVLRVTHRNEVFDLRRKGRILERSVLVHALQAHLDDRIIVYDNKCVVFAD